jgi:hypothetical protein
MKRVGPELKLADLKKVKVPKFASDLYYDLHDRRLLPLVALVLVAIVAAPFLLGGGAEEPEPAPSIGAAPGEAAQTSSLTVVEAQPGLRDYRKRLARRTATNPFKQRFTGPTGNGLPEVESSSSSSTSSGGSAAEVTSTSPAPSGSSAPVESPPPPAPGSPPPSSDAGDLRLYTFGVDVRIIRTLDKPNGGKEKSEPETREEVVPPAPLPSAKSQVVTYMGISPKTQKPLFLVSDDVEAIFGEAKCISGSESCQLLEVDLDMPTTFVYEPTGARFKITVLKVEPVFKGSYDG